MAGKNCGLRSLLHVLLVVVAAAAADLEEEEDRLESGAVSPAAPSSPPQLLSEAVVSVEGGRAELPCDISAPSVGDSVYLVLWYRKDSGTPIYSYDSRLNDGFGERDQQQQQRQDRPDLWSEPTAFGDRAHFRVTSHPAVLGVTGVQKFDGGDYICRVDFRQSPTVYRHVSLDVIVPPQKPLIMDDRGRQVEGDVGIGPFREGDSLTLDCHVPGGKPLPKVLWYMDNKLIDDTYQQTYEGTVKNALTIRKLEREHTQGRLRCLASNNNITRPSESGIKLKMLFPPQGAKILAPLQPLTAEREYDISCQVWGSNPPARVEWYRGTQQEMRPMKAFNHTVMDGGNVTVSWVKYVPKPGHHHQTLTCRGANEEMLTSATQMVEDYHRLEVFFPPSVDLSLGRMVNINDLEEGDDLYFSCEISANPPAYKLTWWHNGEEVTHDKHNGIIISNQSLVLQAVTRRQAGSYTCEASNVEGDQVSKPITVTIMYKPICLEDQKTIYGASEGETAHISCRVDAFPEADVFYWSFNTSSGGAELPKSSYTNQGSASLLSYVPKSQMDYGTVLCWASNAVGRQIVPCVFHVIPAGPPDPPKNCTLTNQTTDSLQVDCRQGFSSGLKQEFHMEVFAHPEHQLLVNITARSPKLLARGLPHDSSLFLRVYASTAKGRSRSVTFEGYTLRMADKQTVVDGSSQAELEKQRDSWSLVSVVLMGAALTLVLFAFVVTLIARIGRSSSSSSGSRRRRAAAAANGSNGCGGPGGGLGGGGKDDAQANTLINKAFQEGHDHLLLLHNNHLHLDKSPDVIPQFGGGGGNGNSPLMENDAENGHRMFTRNGRFSDPLHTNATQQEFPPRLMTSSNFVGVSYSNQQAKQLYSPAATSDSSGFSERESSGFLTTAAAAAAAASDRGLFSLPGHFRSSQQQQQQFHYQFGEGRSGSPAGLFSYHNPSLTASPYSTLPRRPPGSIAGASTATVTTGLLHSPTLMGRMQQQQHSGTMPFLELTASDPFGPSISSSTAIAVGGNNRNSFAAFGGSGGKNQNAGKMSLLKITARTPLLEDDRESCV